MSMAPCRLELLGSYDSVYISPHGHDAAVSCAGRMRWEAAWNIPARLDMPPPCMTSL